jgi:hypothetical protein
VYDPALWKSLAEEELTPHLPMSPSAFNKAAVIYGNIDKLVNRVWSWERYHEAIAAYRDSVLVHDVGDKGSIVHSEYSKVLTAPARFLILTHAPDKFVSQVPVAVAGKTYRVFGGKVCEEVNGELFELNADVYCKDGTQAHVGYRSPKGRHLLVERDGVLSIAPVGAPCDGNIVMRILLLRDVDGNYHPETCGSDAYVRRPDGKLELVKFTARGSSGRMTKSLRRTFCRCIGRNGRLNG